MTGYASKVQATDWPWQWTVPQLWESLTHGCEMQSTGQLGVPWGVAMITVEQSGLQWTPLPEVEAASG